MHVAILGCGQHARLLAEAGQKLGIRFTFVAIENESVDCVKTFGDIVYWHHGISTEALLQAMGNPVAITLACENLDNKLLFELSMLCRISPGPEVFTTCQQRLTEKNDLSKLHIPVIPRRALCSTESLLEAASLFGYPLVIKARENSDDCKKSWQIESLEQLKSLFGHIELNDWIAEPYIDFVAEACLIGVRSVCGEIKFYPVTENYSVSSLLKRSTVPFKAASFKTLPPSLVLVIQKHLKKLMESWQYVGVMTMAFFITETGFMVKALTPRVNNRGLWTQNSGMTCQYENHLRAILGKPLGETELSNNKRMINRPGLTSEFPQLNIIDANIYLYG